MERAVATSLILLFGVTVFARSVDPNAFNYDVAFLIYCAEQMLDGRALYSELIDENPPMIFWLHAMGVAVARLTGTSSILAFNALVFLLAGLASALSQRVLRIGWPESSPAYSLAVVSCFATLALIYPGIDYGQRPNLLFIFVAPYLFAAAASARGKPAGTATAYFIGAFAGIGLCIKPHYALLWLAVELWHHFRSPNRRAWLRPESQAVVAIQLLYGAGVFVFASDYLNMLEMAMAVYSAYGAFGSPMLLFKAATGYLLLAGGLYWLVRNTTSDREVRDVWLVASLAFLAVALLQGKGWDYHYYPAGASALLLVGIIVLGLVYRQESLANVIRPRIASLPLLCMLALCGYSAVSMGQASLAAWGPGSPKQSVVTELSRVVRETAWGKPIYLMSSSVWPSFPLVNLTDARWSSRFCCLWLLPGLYSDQERATRPFPYHSPEAMSELERYVIDSVVSDLEAEPPALLIVDRSQQKQAFLNSDFEYLNYFRRDPRFASFFKQYRELTSVGAFQVYRRRGAGGE